MIRKFAEVPGCRVVPALMLAAILAGAQTARAQEPAAQPPAAQQPATQPPAQQEPAAQPQQGEQSGQEPAPEESTRRAPKPKAYKNWSFNVGGGASLTSGATRLLVRSGGGVASAGVARNYSKYFGLRADFHFDNLPLRNTALELAQAPGATSHLYALTLEPVINIPATREWGGYILFGPAYFHRTGRLDSSVAIPGSTCNPFFFWWGRCLGSSLPLNGNFLSESVNQFGYEFGAAITRRISPNLELYGEFRDLHGSHSGITTDLRPVTIGLRW